MARRALPLLADKKARNILQKLCQDHNITLDLLRSLIEIQRDNLGRGRQVGITQEFSAAISEFIDTQSGGRDVS